MTPPLRRGDFVTIHTDDGRQVRAMVGLASANGVSIMLLFDAMIGGWVQMMPCSEVGDDGSFETLDGMRVQLTRLTREELNADA